MYLDDNVDKSLFIMPPADLTVVYADTCATTQAVLARNVQGIAGYNVSVTSPAGVLLTNSLSKGTAATTIGFNTLTDGVYLTQPIDTAGTVYPPIPVLVVCRLLKCRRAFNKKPATAGPGKRGAADDKLPALDGILRMAYACYYQGDLVSVAALLKKANELCTDCGCGCAEC